jgi:hypothetical protein
MVSEQMRKFAHHAHARGASWKGANQHASIDASITPMRAGLF